MTVQANPSSPSTSATRSAITLSRRKAVIGGIGAVFLLIAPLGPTWLASPAVPAAHIPAMALNYSDLHHLTTSGLAPTTWVQENFFSWLGWLLIAVTILATAAAVLLARRAVGIVNLVLAVAGLLIGLFAAKGALTWSQFSHEIPNLRIGAYLLVVGFLLILVSALTPERR